MKKPFLQPSLFSLENPPVRPPSSDWGNPPVEVALASASLAYQPQDPVENQAPEASSAGVTQVEKEACVALWGQEICTKTCPHCSAIYMLATWHEERCPVDWSTGRTKEYSALTRPAEPQSHTPSGPPVGLKAAPIVLARPAWIGRAISCSLCGEVVPTLRHLDLEHGCEDGGLRGRLLSAYLWPAHRERAQRLDLDVPELRRLILLGGCPEIERELLRQEGLQREFSSQANDPIAIYHPYKGKGVASGAL